MRLDEAHFRRLKFRQDQQAKYHQQERERSLKARVAQRDKRIKQGIVTGEVHDS